jgi:hypothetical protein
MSFIWNFCTRVLKFFRLLKDEEYKHPSEVNHELIEPSNVVIKNERLIFPCIDCVVSANCTELCDKVEMDNDKLTEIARKYNCCPDCGGKKFLEGPQGGLCTNIMCAKCRHRFNASPFGLERIGI